MCGGDCADIRGRRARAGPSFPASPPYAPTRSADAPREVMARENNWTNKTPPISAAMSQIANSLSTWEVTQGDDKFTVTIWVDVSGPPRKVCAVRFPGKVKREEFLN